MLYQLSYLGTAASHGPGAPVYSQARWPCLPGFACGFPGRGPPADGVEPFGVVPTSSNRDLTGGWASAALVSALIFAMTLGGVLAGTKKPNHDDTSKPGTPASAIVGRSGTTEMRSLVVTASARTLPAFTCGRIEGMLSKITSTRPGMRSLIASAPPR